ncbi:MAG: TrkH family potassium uptake protein, partial [Trueperaceae bacterium]
MTSLRSTRGRFAPQIVGLGLLSLAALALVFVALSVLLREPWHGFAWLALVAGVLGAVAVAFGSRRTDPSRRETLVAVLALWATVPLVGAIPYATLGGMPPVDAVFESTSGFTATGATVLTDFASFGSTLFLWRALSQWIGGIGIIVLFIAVFPQLAIAGRQLFAAELPGPNEERLTPRLRNTAGAVLLVYLTLSLACLVGYLAAGMSVLDAVAHAFTTVAAGGFSPEERSFEGLGAAAHWIAICFMLFAGVNFALQYRALSGRPRALLRDPEFRAYLAVVATAAVAATWLLWPDQGTDAVRHGLFNTLSIVTTTGYASLDFGAWEPRQQAVLLLLMFVGGSAGSAAGGIKVVRLLVVAKHTAREVRRALHPRAVLPIRVGARTVPEEVLRSVTAFLTLYLAVFAALTATLVIAGSDFVTAFTASIATLGNIGPGLGLVGPMGSYAGFPDGIKALLTFAMYAGRLEVVAVFVLVT